MASIDCEPGLTLALYAAAVWCKCIQFVSIKVINNSLVVHVMPDLTVRGMYDTSGWMASPNDTTWMWKLPLKEWLWQPDMPTVPSVRPMQLDTTPCKRAQPMLTMQAARSL